MANWNLPTVTDLYTNILTYLDDKDNDSATMFSGGGETNIPTDSVKWNISSNKFEKWSGSAWGDLSSAYSINVLTFNGQVSTYYTNASNLASGTVPAARFNDTSHGVRTGGTLHSVATGSVAGFMSATDKTKIDTVDTNAADDQTPAEILTAIKTVDGPGSGLDADLLDGVQGASYALLASPIFTGNPRGVTTTNNDATTSLATTSFVHNRVNGSATLASASTVNIAATNNNITITGNTTITRFDTHVQNQIRTVKFDDVLTLTHHATFLVLPGGQDIVTAPGDIAVFRHLSAAAGTWECRWYARRNGTALKGLVQRVDATPYTTYSSTTSIMAADDTIPQNTEGTEYVTVSITPTNASNKLIIRADASYVTAGGNINCTMGLFQDSTADAIKTSTSAAVSAYATFLSLEHSMVAGTTSTTTFKIRMGVSSATLYINGATTGRIHGGKNSVTLSVEEVTP